MVFATEWRPLVARGISQLTPLATYVGHSVAKTGSAFAAFQSQKSLTALACGVKTTRLVLFIIFLSAIFLSHCQTYGGQLRWRWEPPVRRIRTGL